MSLEIVDVHKLFLHEEIVARNLEKLKDSFTRCKILSNPIFVDINTNVVLDGTHRVKCFQELGFRYILAAVVNYRDERIKLKNWYRILSGDATMIRSLALDFGFRKVSTTKMDLEKNTGGNLIVAVNGELFIYDGSDDIYEKYCYLREYEKALCEAEIHIDYVHEDEALAAYREGKNIIITPKLTKDDVVFYATRGKVFPPKTTRHIFPLRPLFLDIPLTYFMDRGKHKSEIDNIISRYLLSKMYVKTKGKTTIDRYYEEEFLALFL